MASVVISPATLAVTVNGSAQAQASARDAAGNALARPLSWSSQNPAIFTVSSTGLVTGVAPGSATLVATADGVTGNATVTVTPAPVATVKIALAAASIPVGRTTQATATVRDASGSVLTDRAVAWSSSDPAVASVNTASGIVVGVAPGRAVITGASEGKSDTASVTVVPVPVATVTVALDAATLNTGQTTRATATLTDATGNVVTGRAVTWTSSNVAVATVNASGIVTGVAPGTADIAAASADGPRGSARVTVVLAPVAAVTLTPSSVTLSVGETRALTATAVDAGGAPLAGRAIAFASSNPAVATVSETGVVTGVSPGGPVTVTATSEGKRASAMVSVLAAPAVGAVSYGTATQKVLLLDPGGTAAPTVVARDPAGQVVSVALQFVSRARSVADVDAQGRITARAAGSTWVVARAPNDVADSVFLNVTRNATGPVARTDLAGFAIYTLNDTTVIKVVLDTRGRTVGAASVSFALGYLSYSYRYSVAPGVVGTIIGGQNTIQFNVTSAVGFTGVVELGTVKFVPRAAKQAAFLYVAASEVYAPDGADLSSLTSFTQYPVVVP